MVYSLRSLSCFQLSNMDKPNRLKMETNELVLSIFLPLQQPSVF